jgi:hypothetical protein
MTRLCFQQSLVEYEYRISDEIRYSMKRRIIMGPYDRMFDRNHDGVLDFNERLDMDDYYDRILIRMIGKISDHIQEIVVSDEYNKIREEIRFL